jgi:hypothetical protein
MESTAEKPSLGKRIRNTALVTTVLGLCVGGALIYNEYLQEAARLNIIAGAARAKLTKIAPNVFSLASEGIRPDTRATLHAIDEQKAATVFFDENGNNRIDSGEPHGNSFFIGNIPLQPEDVLREVVDPDSPLNKPKIQRELEGIGKDLRMLIGW